MRDLELPPDHSEAQAGDPSILRLLQSVAEASIVPASRPARGGPVSVDSAASMQALGFTPWTVRIASFLSIGLGVLSLLSLWTGLAAGVLSAVLLPPAQALGLIFLGFAVRMSRLEGDRRPVRVIVQTSRIGLVALGLASIAGTRLLKSVPYPLEGGGSVAAGVVFLLTGIALMLRNSRVSHRAYVGTTALIATFLAASWLSMLFATLGLAQVPEVLRLNPALLALLTAVASILLAAARTPSVLKFLRQSGPEAEAARLLFPLAFAIPVCLAVLRQVAEGHGLIQTDLGLLLHVLLSSGCMAVMIVWNANRIQSAKQVEEAVDTATRELHAQYFEVFGAMPEPVWVFSSHGHLCYRNDAAREFSPGEGESPAVTDGTAVLGIAQQKALLSAALLGRQVGDLQLRDRYTGEARQLPIRYMRSLRKPRGEPGHVVLVASAPRGRMS
jgi:PAS domain-containing protein